MQATLCEGLKRFGFTKRNKVRLYGQEFELLSDPFLENGSPVVEALEIRSSRTRRLAIPSVVVKMAEGSHGAAAA